MGFKFVVDDGNNERSLKTTFSLKVEKPFKRGIGKKGIKTIFNQFFNAYVRALTL